MNEGRGPLRALVSHLALISGATMCSCASSSSRTSSRWRASCGVASSRRDTRSTSLGRATTRSGWRSAVDYDAIVLDLMLPGVDGIEVCRRCARERRLVAGAHADGARRGRGSGRRARRGCGRLPAEAVLVRRAPRTATRAGAARQRRASRRSSRSATCGSTRRRIRCGGDRRRSSSRRRSSRCSRRSCDARAGSLTPPAHRARVGLRATRTARTSWTCTCATCGTRSTGRSIASSIETVRGVGLSAPS